MLVQDTAQKLSVTALVVLLQEVVESNFIRVSVEGEISNFTAAASGHWYFTLKDSGAQLRGVMFRGRNRLVKVTPQNGQKVVCNGSVTLYSARGELQLVADSLSSVGQGDLQANFEALKQQLAAEGLFDAERKRPLPAFPKAVGVVTSASGAAIHDILTVMKRRAPDVRVLLRPVKVQGQGAALEIAQAIADLNRHGEVDVLIVGRGGGSLEDLWAFNEEVVARAIAASMLPVLSAVGHETDFSIADFVADLRAPTPSAAAELVAKNRLELEAHLDQLTMRLRSYISNELALVGERLQNLFRRLRLSQVDLSAFSDEMSIFERRLSLAIKSSLRQHSDRLALASGRLDALSPLTQLQRGYVLATIDHDGVSPAKVQRLNRDDILWLRFSEGRAKVRVEEIEC